MYRVITAGVVLLWITAMTMLFLRDVWPSWTAQDVPPIERERIASLEQPNYQYGIFRDDQRAGTAWSSMTLTPETTSIHGTVVITNVGFIPALRVENEVEFDATGRLDNFWLEMHGVPGTRVYIRGERHGIYLPCEIHLGRIHRQANLEMSATRMISDAFQPFTYLPTLHVGQSWRMQLLNPMSAVLTRQIQFSSVVAEVTRIETIEHRGKPVRCFVVETSPAQVTAWVGPDGRVLVQEVQLGGLGRIRVRAEPYDEGARAQAKQRIRTWQGRW